MNSQRHWVLWGCALWILGSIGFLIAAVRAGDGVSVGASVLFIAGIVLFAVPEFKR